MSPISLAPYAFDYLFGPLSILSINKPHSSSNLFLLDWAILFHQLFYSWNLPAHSFLGTTIL